MSSALELGSASCSLGCGQGPTTIEWIFLRTPSATFVTITNSGFSGDGDKIVEQAMESAAGFELVLAGLSLFGIWDPA
jgi:hypothetical protein